MKALWVGDDPDGRGGDVCGRLSWQWDKLQISGVDRILVDGAFVDEIAEVITHVQELAGLFCGQTNRIAGRHGGVFGGTSGKRGAGHFREASGALIDLEHGNVAGGGIDDEQEAAQTVDGYGAALQVVGERRAGDRGESAGLPVLSGGRDLRRRWRDRNGAENILLLRRLCSGADGKDCLQKKVLQNPARVRRCERGGRRGRLLGHKSSLALREKRR